MSPPTSRAWPASSSRRRSALPPPISSPAADQLARRRHNPLSSSHLVGLVVRRRWARRPTSLARARCRLSSLTGHSHQHRCPDGFLTLSLLVPRCHKVSREPRRGTGTAREPCDTLARSSGSGGCSGTAVEMCVATQSTICDPGRLRPKRRVTALTAAGVRRRRDAKRRWPLRKRVTDDVGDRDVETRARCLDDAPLEPV